MDTDEFTQVNDDERYTLVAARTTTVGQVKCCPMMTIRYGHVLHGICESVAIITQPVIMSEDFRFIDICSVESSVQLTRPTQRCL